MDDDDFNPFSNFNDNRSIPQYLEFISQSHDIPTFEEEVEEQFVDHQHSKAEGHAAIPDLNMDYEPESGEEEQHLPRKRRKQFKDDERQAVYDLLLQKSVNIPLRKKTTLRDLAAATGVSKRYLSSKMKRGEIRRHTNAIKPILTEANQLQKIAHCLSMMEPNTLPANQNSKR